MSGGYPAAPGQQPYGAPPAAPGAAPRQPAKPKKKTPIIIAAVIVVVVIAAAILIPFLIEQNRVSRYESGEEMMASGDFSGAEEMFLGLGDYEDAANRAVEARNEIDYATATELMDNEEYEDAAEIFNELGSFKDSSNLATRCQNYIDYNEAVALIEEGKYVEAATLLEGLGSFEDADILLEECADYVTYNDAVTAYEAGRYYDAYVLFSGLGSFEDAADRAQQCIQPTPGNRELYHNDAYSGSHEITFYHTDVEDWPSYVKIYAEDGTHVSTIFIEPRGEVTIRLPDGVYYFHRTYGESWFGENDMFGPDASFTEILWEGDRLVEITGSGSIRFGASSYEFMMGNKTITKEEF